MQFQITDSWQEAAGCTAVLSFMPAGQKAAFADRTLQAAYTEVFAEDDLTPEEGKISTFRLPVDGRVVTVLAAGTDFSSPALLSKLRALTGRAGTMLKELNARTVYMDLPAFGQVPAGSASLSDALMTIASTLPLAEYSFDKYYSKKAEYKDVTVCVGPAAVPAEAADAATDAAADAVAEGALLADSVCIARDLVNDQAESLTPVEMASRVTVLGERFGFETEILDRARCEELGMGLFLAVARGSKNEPAFIIMRYKGGPADTAPIGFVGKGITYDSGGYHIKTGGMESMYMDMNGGAGVIGAMCAIAGRKLPVNVTAVVAACENMVDAAAYRNGDVLRSMNGMTVFVQNTDAEGRLTMADAITYLVRFEKPCEVIEMAGLTGSVCNFYGDICAAALPTEHFLYDRIAALTELSGEKYACMPEFPEYKEQLKSPYADMTNAPSAAPGIGAAQFLCAFSEGVPFISIDTGKMPFNSRVYDGHPAGATGFGVRTLYFYARQT